MQKIITWSDFKNFVDDRSLKIQEQESDFNYELTAQDGFVFHECTVEKDGGSDQTDYETNYQDDANQKLTAEDDSGIPFVKTKPFSDPDSLRFRATGFTGTASKATIVDEEVVPTETNIDYTVDEDRYFSGIEFICKNHVFGDSIKLQIVDKDGVYYDAGTVLDEFGTNWNLAEDEQRQGPYILNYCSKILADLYIRLVYKSNGTTNDVSVGVNCFLHKKTV